MATFRSAKNTKGPPYFQKFFFKSKGPPLLSENFQQLNSLGILLILVDRPELGVPDSSVLPRNVAHATFLGRSTLYLVCR